MRGSSLFSLRQNWRREEKKQLKEMISCFPKSIFIKLIDKFFKFCCEYPKEKSFTKG